MKWSEMTWNEMKWNEMKWNEMKWNEMKWNEMKWNEMKWNEMKWNEMKWNDPSHGPRLVSDRNLSYKVVTCLRSLIQAAFSWAVCATKVMVTGASPSFEFTTILSAISSYPKVCSDFELATITSKLSK